MKVLHLPNLSATDRRAAIRTQLVAWQPFATPTVVVGEVDDYAIGVAWDTNVIADLLRSAGQDPSSVRLAPETCMRLPCAQDGWRLVAGLDGFDTEYWKGGRLQQSRWWPSQPDEAQWHQWLRQSSAVPAEMPPVSATADVLSPRPWLRVRPLLDGDAAQASVLERRLVQSGCIAAAAVTGMLAHQAVDAWQARSAIEAELAVASSAAQEVVRVRDEAYAIRAAVERVSGHLAAPLAAEVLQHLGALLPKGTQAKELEMAGRTLRLTVSVPPAMPRSTVVKVLQEGGWFADVREIRSSAGGVDLAVEMQIKGVQPPARMASGPLPAASASPPTGGFPLPAAAPAARK